VQLYPVDGDTRHSTFIPGIYNPIDAENALPQMVAGGYNVARVWCYK
jgi:hypothetical protein